MLTERDRQIISDMAHAGSCELSDSDWTILGTPVSQVATLNEAQKSRLNEVIPELGRGFFHLGARGYEFVDPKRIREHFGRTLRENYPEANNTFLSFATTYWTFKLWVNDHEPDLDRLPVGVGMMPDLEQQVASVFFPTPGPIKIGAKIREATQRQLFAENEVPINVEEFMTGNPILIRDRQSGRSGCAGSVVGLAALGVGSLSRFLT